MVSRINAMEGVSCLCPEGAFYILMNIKSLLGKWLGGVLIENDNDFAVAFLKESKVAVIRWKTSKREWTGWKPFLRDKKPLKCLVSLGCFVI